MIQSSTSLLLFTAADTGGRAVFRAVRIDLVVTPGSGKRWVDVSRGNGAERGWQRHLQNLDVALRRRYDLPWDSTDLHCSLRGRDVVLDGASASLPVFVAWLSLASGAPLPEPFLATGVAPFGSDALSPAPRAYLQRKLAVADACARQVHGLTAACPIWVPEGSEYDASPFPALDVREVPSLPEAATRILGIHPRATTPGAPS